MGCLEVLPQELEREADEGLVLESVSWGLLAYYHGFHTRIKCVSGSSFEFVWSAILW